MKNRISLLMLALYLFAVNTSAQRVFLHTDQDVYMPGATVYFKAYLDQAVAPDNLTNLEIFLVDPVSGVVQTEKFTISQPILAGSFSLAYQHADGLYRLAARCSGTPVEWAFVKDIRIQVPEIPGVIIDLIKPVRPFKPNESVTLSVGFQGPDGQAQSKLKYSWSVNLNGQSLQQGTGRADKSGKDEITLTYPATNPEDLVSVEVQVDYFGNVYQAPLGRPADQGEFFS